MRICIAGADCFIGIPLVKAFANTGNDIVAVVRDGKVDNSLFDSSHNVEIIPLDFKKYEKLGDIVGSVDCLIILTWIGTRGEARQNKNLQRENYEKISKAIKSVIANGCKKVLTAGSQAEYGLFHGIIKEDTPCNPNTEYGKYKLKLFNDMSEYCTKHDVSYKEPRFFSLYGPGDYSGTLIMSSLQKMKLNQDCDFTESIQMWDYLYVDDAVDAVVGIALTNCQDGVYNIGSGDRRQLKCYIEELKTIVGSKSKLNFGSIPYGESGIVSIEPDISKLKKEIGWRPNHTFKEGILAIFNSK